MSQLKNLTCPNCGAPLAISGNEAQVTCAFCGNVVEVPPEMRHTPPVQTPPPVIMFAPSTARPTPYNRRRSSAGVLLVLSILVLVFVVLGVVVWQTVGLAGISGSVSRLIPTAVPTVPSFGGEGTGAGLFSDPVGLAIDGQDYIYVSDRKTSRIQRFDPNGHYVSYWQVTGLPAGVPITCLAADWAGNVYVCEEQGLWKYNGASGAHLPAGDFTGRSLWGMDAVTTLLDGTVVTCSCTTFNATTIFKFDGAGNVLAKYDNAIEPHEDDQTTSPGWIGMAVDGLGNLYVLDAINSHVFVFKADGTFVNRFGSKGSGADQLYYSRGAIAVDGHSNVLVGDGNVVKVFDNDGHFVRSFPIPTNALALAFNSTGALYMLGDDKKVYKLNVSTTQK